MVTPKEAIFPNHNPPDSFSSFLQTTTNLFHTVPASPDSSSASLSIPFPREGVKGDAKPAFLGNVYSLCHFDEKTTRLMTVWTDRCTRFDIPFISHRTPEWIQNIFVTVRKSKRKRPVFRLFMDCGDAESYVRRLNTPSGTVGACRLDLAYEDFKEKPHLFQFVPNENQVKEANKVLKTMPQNGEREKVDGVPVFSAQNLDIAIATTDGIKWHTPYFFDKKMLDSIPEDSLDQHFDSMIKTRKTYRRNDVFDDSLVSEMAEVDGESIWEPEVQEVLDLPEIPMGKAAGLQLLYAVDKVLLGNRQLRKVTGIQPKFPYMVESFEKRVEYTRASTQELQSSPFLPKITMVWFPTGELSQMGKTKVKETMEDIITALKLADQGFTTGNESKHVDRDPLFVSNVEHYYAFGWKVGSSRFVLWGILY